MWRLRTLLSACFILLSSPSTRAVWTDEYDIPLQDDQFSIYLKPRWERRYTTYSQGFYWKPGNLIVYTKAPQTCYNSSADWAFVKTSPACGDGPNHEAFNARFQTFSYPELALPYPLQMAPGHFCSTEHDKNYDNIWIRYGPGGESVYIDVPTEEKKYWTTYHKVLHDTGGDLSLALEAAMKEARCKSEAWGMHCWLPKDGRP